MKKTIRLQTHIWLTGSTLFHYCGSTEKVTMVFGNYGSQNLEFKGKSLRHVVVTLPCIVVIAR